MLIYDFIFKKKELLVGVFFTICILIVINKQPHYDLGQYNSPRKIGYPVYFTFVVFICIDKG